MEAKPHNSRKTTKLQAQKLDVKSQKNPMNPGEEAQNVHKEERRKKQTQQNDKHKT